MIETDEDDERVEAKLHIVQFLILRSYMKNVIENAILIYIFFSCSVIAGATCGGSCCSNATELELRHKAAGKFEQLLHHHTSSLRGILETTASQFQSEYSTYIYTYIYI